MCCAWGLPLRTPEERGNGTIQPQHTLTDRTVASSEQGFGSLDDAERSQLFRLGQDR